MDRAEIEAAIQAAFIQCEIALCPLTDRQKQILLQIATEAVVSNLTRVVATTDQDGLEENPLDQLPTQQRQALLDFIQAQKQEDIPWKVKLLNDWLNNRDSGSVQFIRDNYGPQWLNRVQKIHVIQYLEEETARSGLKLKVGDRLEVCNALWEWVQDEGPCRREWYPCKVVGVSEVADGEASCTNCTIRFDSGAEFEIQGIYQWNRYYWRFPSD